LASRGALPLTRRAPLIFQKFENIVKLVRDKQRPIPVHLCGQGASRDDEGKRFIQHIIHLSEYSELKGLSRLH